MAKTNSDSTKVFAPRGAIDLHVAPELRASLLQLIDAQPKRLVVDLSDVPYVDSSGIAMLILGMQAMEQHGGRFILAQPQEAVRAILESAKLDQYFQLAPTVDAALTTG